MRPAIQLSLLVRTLNALSTNTLFAPDEYYQSLEIAHKIVFGYGYRTWEWRVEGGAGGIRSPLYPVGVFVPVYWLVKALGLDSTIALVSIPCGLSPSARLDRC